MENQVILVPSKEKRILISTAKGDQEFRGPKEVVKFFQTLQGPEVILLGIMGGPGQSLFVRASQGFGIPVWRIPHYRLQELTGLTIKATPKERAQAIQQAWEAKSNSFYPMEVLETIIGLIRQLTRVRLSIQDTFRKPAQLQYQGAWRELEVLLPEGEELLDLKTFFANPKFIEGAKLDEKELEARIEALVKTLPIWTWIHPAKDSILPPIKGFGPSVGGSVISEIGDIRRFPTRESLRAYARFHLTKEGKFPKRVTGEFSPWNRYLNRALWWWSTDQMPRYEHPWRLLYDWKKAKELQAHPEVQTREMRDRRGRLRTIYDYTLKHLDMRAKRWTGSQLLNYLWDLWQEVERSGDPELWYLGSSWPAFFVRIERELKDKLWEFLKAEIPKRRRREPKPEDGQW